MSAGPAFLQRWGLLLVTALALVVAVVTFDPRIDPEIDSADYTVLGKAIRAGLGMRYIHLPDAPKPDKFPIGFPLLLAGVEWLAPDSLVARKALVAACYVGAVPLVFRLAFTYVAPLPAFLVTLLVALNPFVLGMARIVMSELPYLCLSLLALWGLERALAGPGQWGAWGGGLLALLCAAQVRTLGWSLLLALLLVLLLQRRYRTLGLVLGGVGLLAGVLLLAGVGPIGTDYLKIWHLRMTAPAAAGPGTAPALSRLATSALSYGWLVIPAALLPMPLWPVTLVSFRTLPSVLPAAPGTPWGSALQALLVGLCLLLLALGAWPSLRRLRLTPIYTAASLGILLVWPTASPRARMIVPVIPFFFLFGAIGLHRLWTWARPKLPALDRAVPVLVGALILPQLWGSVSLGVLDSHYAPQWEEFVEMAEWIRTHTDPHDLVLSQMTAHLYILSGRKGDFLFRGQSIHKKIITSFAQALQHFDETGATYLVHGRIRGRSKALETELFARLEQPGSGWRIAYVGRYGAIYMRDDRPLSPQTLQEAPRAPSE